jgi:hypothetical protein
MFSRMKGADKQIYITLWIACIIGALSILPYAFHLSGMTDFSFFSWATLLTALQAAVLFGIVCWLSYLIVPKTDLKPFEAKDPLKKIVYPGMIGGVVLGLVLWGLSSFIFSQSAFTGMHPPIWKGAVASLYGAVNEEVLLRLLFFSLFYFLFRKIFPAARRKRLLFLWSTNVIVALLFGLGHLPLAFKVSSMSSFEVFRILFLNGIAGCVFGWLYFSRGLWSAMVAHFVADWMVHVFLT